MLKANDMWEKSRKACKLVSCSYHVHLLLLLPVEEPYLNNHKTNKHENLPVFFSWRVHCLVIFSLTIYIIGRAGASPPSRTAAIIFLYIYLFIYLYISVRTSCPKSSTCFFFSDISIFLRRKCYTRFFFSDIYLTCMRHAPWIRQPWKVPSTLIVTFESEEVLFIEL